VDEQANEGKFSSIKNCIIFYSLTNSQRQKLRMHSVCLTASPRIFSVYDFSYYKRMGLLRDKTSDQEILLVWPHEKR